MSSRRPFEILKDAEVAIEAAASLTSLAQALTVQADEIRRVAVEELKSVGLEGALSTISSAGPSGDPQVAAIASAAFRSVMSDLSIEPLVGGASASADVLHVEDVPEGDPVDFLGVKVPFRCRREAEEIIESARVLAMSQGALKGPLPFSGHRGRHIWKQYLYQAAYDASRSAPAAEKPVRVDAVSTSTVDLLGTTSLVPAEVVDSEPLVVPEKQAPAPVTEPPIRRSLLDPVHTPTRAVPEQSHLELPVSLPERRLMPPLPKRGGNLPVMSPAGSRGRKSVSEEGTRSNLGFDRPFENSDAVLAHIAAQRGKN